MKNRQNLRNGQALTVALILVLGISLTTQAQNQANPVKNVQAQDSVITTESAKSIPFQEIGAKATADYHGNAIGIHSTPKGAQLLTAFQKLSGTVTREGLRLESTADKGGGLHLVATSIGRDGHYKSLPTKGKVKIGENTVTFTRPGLTEEYSASVDGVKQDFIIGLRPTGTGDLRVELALTGAHAETSGTDGVKLILNGSERILAYNRLRVLDATGSELKATLEVLSANRLSVRVSDAFATYPVRIDPTFSDANWVSMNPGVPGTNGVVSALVFDSFGNLYIGGAFSRAGTVSMNNIAKWNGSAWTALGTGIGDNWTGQVNALALDGSGNLYAGGQFTTAGGTSANNIAKWNGSAWSVLDSGLGTGLWTDQVYALALDGSGNLYVAGQFTTAGGTSANNIAKWNGSTWSTLGMGLNNVVYALALDGSGNLYAGGGFTTAGGISANNIAKWNGSVWSALGTGIGRSGCGDFVNALALDGSGNLYAGGGFTTAGGTSANNIAKWNGNTWSALGTGINNYVCALALDDSGNLYAGGWFTTAGGSIANNIAKWNGNTWSALGTGMNNYVYALALDDSGNLYAGGWFTTAGGSVASYIAKLNNSTWSALGADTGMNNQVLALALDGSGNLYAGGQFTTAGGTSACYIAKWNGGTWSALSWSALSTGNDKWYDQVCALALDGSGNLYAGGRFTTVGGITVNNIAKWNGSAWSPLGTGVWAQVYALTLDASGNLYAGGISTTQGGTTSINDIAKWDGSAWSALGTGLGTGAVYTLALDGSGNLYVGGMFTTAGGTSANNIAKWSGSAWSNLGVGLNNSVWALALDGSGNLYVGGQFTTAGGTSANNIAKWNGSAWSSLGTGVGTGVNDYVCALALDGSGNLYAGGWFTTAGGTSANNIAKWNGSAWSALGTGVNDYVNALALDSANHLFVGGNFISAGSTVSPFIVQANLQDSSLVSPAITANPSNLTISSGSTAVFTATATGTPSPTVQWQVSTTGTGGTFSNLDGVVNPTALTGTLTLTNVSQAQSGYSYQAVFTNTSGSVSSTPATLTVSRTFAWFQAQYGSTYSVLLADPIGTGVKNLQAYAFGLNPANPDRTQLPQKSIQGNYLQISYPQWKDATDLTYVVEVSGDLITWNSGPGYTQQVSVNSLDATRQQIIQRDLIPITSAARRFIRVRISTP